MTFRPKPVSGRTRPTFGDSPDRRNLYLNVGFAVVVVLSVLLLGIAAGLNWYDDHLASAATVEGETITKDHLRERVLVEDFRLDLQGRRLRDRLQAGTIRETDYASAEALIAQTRQQVATIALERLIDGALQAKYAAEEGVTIAEADVDSKFTELANTPELRHAWLIEIEPVIAPTATEPTPEQLAAARAAADKALADIRGGQDFAEVAKAVSTHATRDQGGDIGYIADDAGGDPAFVEALFALESGASTDVLVDADGVARIGSVTDIVAEAATPAFEEVVVDGGTTVEALREALRAEAVRDALEAKIIADVSKSGPQRFVRRIYLQTSESEASEGAVRTRHILYSPNDDPEAASAGEIEDDDPAWKVAEDAARAAHAKIAADLDLFDSIARAESDESAARTSGGKLPYFAPGDSIDEAFAAAIFAAGLQPGQLLAPVKSSFGWHVIQIMHGPTDFDWAQKLQDEATTLDRFKTLARDNSDDAESEQGGEIGWVARGQIEDLQEAKIFNAPIGKADEPIAVPDDGVYLFWVEKEEVRAPEGEQLDALRETAFDTWYSEKKLTAQITRDASLTGAEAG